jgi:uncharacterized protein YndB with AHSA1/START domain
MTTSTAVTTQVYQIFINAPAQRIWDAITQPEWTQKYGYACPQHFELRPGGAFSVTATQAMAEHGAPEVIIRGEVLEADPPHRLVQTWQALFTPEIEAEGARRLTWEISEVQPGVCRLTVTHDLTDAPLTAEQVTGAAKDAGGGWPMIISDLKSLLENGRSMFAHGG